MTHATTVRPAGRMTDPRTESGAILVALKPDGAGTSALAMAAWIAAHEQRELQVLSVLEPAPDFSAVAAGVIPMSLGDYDDDRASVAERLRALVDASIGDDDGARVDVMVGATSATIASVARDRVSSLIVVGTGRHAAFGRLVHGERALEIVRDAAGPVLVVPPTACVPIRSAVVAVDFSQASLRAAVLALGMLEPGGRLTLVHVRGATHVSDTHAGWWTETYERRVADMFLRFTSALPVTPDVTIGTELLLGGSADALVRFVAEQGADLLACGRRRHSLVERIMVGSVSSALVRRAPCALLVAPERPYDRTFDNGTWITGISVTRNPDEWADFLRAFNQRNIGRRTQLELQATTANGAASLENGYQLLGVDYDVREERVHIMLGDPDTPGSHLTHRIAGLRAMEMVTDANDQDTRLQFDAAAGRCTLTFMDLAE